MLTNTYLGPIYLSLAASIWGGMYVVSKVVLDVISPLELLWLRYIVALIALIIMGLITRQSWKLYRKDIPLIIAIGIIGYYISIWAQFTGTQMSSAQMGAVITSSTPAFMVLFARFLLKETITFKKGLSVVLATIGVLLIVGINAGGTSSQLGGLILGIAALTWALMSVLVKRVPANYSPLVITTYSIFIAALAMTPFVMTHMNWVQMNIFSRPVVWGGILYIGIVSTAGAFYFWNNGLQLIEAGRGGLYFFLQPVVGSLLGWLILGEEVDITFWLGTSLILGGIILVIKDA